MVEQMCITHYGYVGIGTPSPGRQLHIAGTNNILRLESTSTVASRIEFENTGSSSSDSVSIGSVNNDMQLVTSGSERMRIDSAGRLLLGTSNSSDNIRLDQKLAIANASSSSSSHTGINITNYSNQATVCPVIDLKKSRSNTDGGTTVVQNGDNLGYLVFQGADGSQFHRAAEIAAFVDGTPGANDMPGRLVFSTTADGASSPTERMRINSAGAIGLSGANYGASGQVLTSNGSGSAPTWQNSATAQAWVHFDGGAGTITPADSYNVSSITDRGTGRYTVNLTNTLGSSSPACVASGDAAGSRFTRASPDSTDPDDKIAVEVRGINGGFSDDGKISVVVFA